MQRRNMLPPAPEEIQDQGVEIQYVSILATAQQAIAAAPTERWIGLIGNLAGRFLRFLKFLIGMSLFATTASISACAPKNMRSREDVQAELDAHERARSCSPSR
jgi:hypothetical protein